MEKTRKRRLPPGWYPETKKETLREIEKYSGALTAKGKIGGVIPHAGWYYSGELAASVINALKEREPELVILYGGHLPEGAVPLIVTGKSWQTPLGEMTIETGLADKVKEDFGLAEDLSSDNTLEIQLPLIKYYFPTAKLLALRLPESLEAAKLSEGILEIIKDKYKKYIILASTDLTHYGSNYDFAPAGSSNKALAWARRNDESFIELAIRLKTRELLEHADKNRSACSSGAVAGLTSAVKMMGGKAGSLIGYKTSYDVTPSDSFVGYAGIVY